VFFLFLRFNEVCVQEPKVKVAFTFQLVIWDDQVFDFIEEISNYLEGMIAQEDLVGLLNESIRFSAYYPQAH